MHFFGVLMQVHFEAKKHGMQGLTDAELPKLREVVRAGLADDPPLFALLMVLFSGYTPYLAAFWGITGCMLVGLAQIARPRRSVFALAIGLAAPTEFLRRARRQPRLHPGGRSRSWPMAC